MKPQFTLGGYQMNKNKRKLKLIKEEGSGLVLALMVLLVLSVLGASLGVVTIGSLQLSTVNRDSNSAYYIAEAGANMAYEELKGSARKSFENSENSTDFYTGINSDMKEFFIEKNYDKNIFTRQHGNFPTAKVKLTKEDTGDTRKYKIQSTGEVGGKERTVEKPVEIIWKPLDIQVEDPLSIPKGAAVIIKKDIEMNSSNVKIIGDLYIEEKNSGEKLSKITGKVISGEKNFKKINFEQFEKYGKILEERAEKIKEKLDVDSNEVLKGDYKKNKLHIKNNEIIRINIQDNDVFLSIEEFKQTGGVFEVIGSGTLTILVSDEFKINGGQFNPEKSKVRIVLEGGDLSISGNPEVKVYAQIIAPDSGVSVSRNLFGAVISENITLHGNGQINYYNFNFSSLGTGNGESAGVGEYDITPGPTLEIDK